MRDQLNPPTAMTQPTCWPSSLPAVGYHTSRRSLVPWPGLTARALALGDDPQARHRFLTSGRGCAEVMGAISASRSQRLREELSIGTSPGLHPGGGTSHGCRDVDLKRRLQRKGSMARGHELRPSVGSVSRSCKASKTANGLTVAQPGRHRGTPDRAARIDSRTRPNTSTSVKAAVAAGVRHIDTAHLYTRGESERPSDRALRSRTLPRGCDRRDQRRLRRRRGKGGRRVLRAADRAQPSRACETASIALYYLHRVDPETPLEDSLGAIKEYRRPSAQIRAGRRLQVGIATHRSAPA